MKKLYLRVTQRIWPVLLWTVLLMSHTAWGQSVPDSQWARLGKTLVITTDGNIVTTESISSPSIPGQLTQSGDQLVKYSLQGDKLWSTGYLKGGFYIGGKIQGIDYESIRSIAASAATATGGVTVAGPLNVRGGSNVAVTVAANGTFSPWADSEIFNSFVGEDIPRDVVSTPGGGFIVLYSITRSNATSGVLIRRYTPGNLPQTKEIAYPNPAPASPDLSLTRGQSIINTPDGGYLIAGYFKEGGSTGPQVGWVAKLDGDGNVSWQKLLTGLPVSMNFNGPLPGSIQQMVSVTDVIPAADGNGYALVGNALEVAKYPTATPAILELNADGSFKRARSIEEPATESFITLYTGSGGRKYYAVGNTSLQNGADPQISLVNPATLPLTDPALLKVEARRTFDGPSDGSLVALGTAGDGSLVFASSANQVVKLVPETTSPPAGALTLTQPTYNCQTGAITFNTTGGDGSTITYNAPGISRSSATSNTGIVEPGLRNDPKPIPITATQNGQTVSYTFDFKAFCNGSQPPVNPPTPSPGGALALTQPTYNCQTGAIVFNTMGGNGSPITYSAPGISRSSATSNSGTVEPGLRNDPKPITITATQNGQTASYTFDFGAYCANPQPPVNPPMPPTPPPGSPLTLLAPTYDCASGAIVFRTSGGNGSTIEYAAVGITGWTTNPNQFVDRDSRTAADVKPFTLMARQNGLMVSYVWDLKAACGRARVGAEEGVSALSVSVLGNPVDGKSAAVEIRGVTGQAVQVDLIDLQGRVLHRQRINQAGSTEQVSIPMDNSQGMLLLNVSTATQRRQVKLLKP